MKLINVIIYGAGQLGAELADSLIKERKYRVISFFDDSPKLWGRTLNGISIQKPKIDANLRKVADQILIAIPSLNQQQFKYIFEEIKHYKLPIFKVPSIEDLAKKYSRFTFRDNYNLQTWRFVIGQEDGETIASYMKPKNGSKDIEEICCSTFMLATAGPTLFIARVIAVSLDEEILFPSKTMHKNKFIFNILFFI